MAKLDVETLDAAIIKALEKAKFTVIDEDKIHRSHALDAVTMLYIVKSAKGLIDATCYWKSSHIRAVSRFLLEYYSVKKRDWRIIDTMAEHLIDNEERYFPNHQSLLLILNTNNELRNLDELNYFNMSVKNLLLRSLGFSVDESITIKLNNGI